MSACIVVKNEIVSIAPVQIELSIINTFHLHHITAKRMSILSLRILGVEKNPLGCCRKAFNFHPVFLKIT